MIRSALAYLFQIHDPQPVKLFMIGLLMLSVGLKLALASRVWRRLPLFAVYLIAASLTSLLQKSPLWGYGAEKALTFLTVAFIWETFTQAPKSNRALLRWFGASIGMLILAVMLYLNPKPFGNLPAPGDYLRMYSAGFCFAAGVGALAFTWSEHRPLVNHNLLVPLWFAGTLFGSRINVG